MNISNTISDDLWPSIVSYLGRSGHSLQYSCRALFTIFMRQFNNGSWSNDPVTNFMLIFKRPKINYAHILRDTTNEELIYSIIRYNGTNMNVSCILNRFIFMQEDRLVSDKCVHHTTKNIYRQSRALLNHATITYATHGLTSSKFHERRIQKEPRRMAKLLGRNISKIFTVYNNNDRKNFCADLLDIAENRGSDLVKISVAPENKELYVNIYRKHYLPLCEHVQRLITLEKPMAISYEQDQYRDQYKDQETY